MDKVDEILDRGVVNAIPDRNSLEKALRSGKRLSVYMGIDPTATRIHLGHAVPLRKLQTLSELGHNVTFLIGDFTALIGDASDKDSERPILTGEEIRRNFKTYQKQAEKVLDFSKVSVRYNSSWLKKIRFEEILKLAQHFSVGDFVGRKLIRERLTSGKRVRLDETLYPVMQGYDSFFMDTDLQIGGADQTFNMQAGRVLQKDLRDKESFILVTDYLTGTDGRKMSKSWGNAIWIADSAGEMYGKVMSINDSLIGKYFELATKLTFAEIDAQMKIFEKGDHLSVKEFLALTITSEHHGREVAQRAQNEFNNTFRKGKPKFDKPWVLKKGASVSDLVSEYVGSKSEAKRKIAEGAIDVDSKTATDPNFKLEGGERVKIGKRLFVKVVAK